MAKNLSKLFQNAEEVIEPEEAILTGEIPEWLNGSFIRVGPGKWDLGTFTMNHFLDGYALLSKFDINGQSVKFQSKFLESDAYLKAMIAEKPLLTEFGTRAYSDPASKGLFSKIISSITPLETTDNALYSLFQLSSNDLFVTSNTTFFRRIDPVTLSTGEKYDYSKCFGVNGVSVHPLRDEEGDLYNIGFSYLTGTKYQIMKMSGDEKYQNSEDMSQYSKTICSIPSRWSTAVAFFHSFGMSRNYIIFIEMPYCISLGKAAKSMIKGSTFKDWLEWCPGEPCKFFIIQKKSGNLLKINYISKAFFFLHVINCYEEDNQIVIELNAYSSPAVIESLYLKNLRCNSKIVEKDPPCIQRFVIPLTSSLTSLPEEINLVTLPNSKSTAIRKGSQITLCSEVLSLSGLELPTINPKFLGKKSKYLYAVGTVVRNDFTNSICRINTTEKDTSLWKGTPWNYPGEPLFVPRQEDQMNSNLNAEDEDDGVIISACSNTKEEGEGSSDGFLVFLDPKTMKEVGRATFKSRIPQAMHGIFLRN